jgi:SNF2 family DNA or RNA helicase
VKTELRRDLKEHQVKAALHLLAVRNGANFSVPGSGKTTVVLTIYHKLRLANSVDSIFVVGPPSCFGPWRTEYRSVIGREPSCEILAGGDIEDRKSRYQVRSEAAADLYLTTFQTLQRDQGEVGILFKNQGIRFFMVIDEAHYMKQLDGAWANAVLAVGRYAERRCVLTGTPFPKSYVDAFNLFDFLWPDHSPLPEDRRHRIELLMRQGLYADAASELDAAIGPLSYRVRKQELGLAPQKSEVIAIDMNKHERVLYDSILDRIRSLSRSDYFRNVDLLLRLRRGRMMRLRQCVSYAKLLASAVTDYDEDILGEDPSLTDVLVHYDELERPRKLEVLVDTVDGLLDAGEKVLIWSTFVKTLELIRSEFQRLGRSVRLIYGATPTEQATAADELSRDQIIQQFLDPRSGVDVLVANPAACAESVSLHKTCSHAVYYDLSYNCAQYLQSMDRIHRVGGSEHRPANYYFLQYRNSIDSDILANVAAKAKNMSAVIDEDYPIYSLDMFTTDEELGAYERLFSE